jgi:hypothetical protein
VRIHVATEHALEFELANPGLDLAGIERDLARRLLIVLGLGQLQQFTGVARRIQRAVEIGDFGAQPGAFLAQFLGALGLVPDGGVFELARYLFETFLLQVVFKETPSRRRHAPRDLSGYA